MPVKVVVIDGQGGKIGRLLVESIKASKIDCKLLAIGTNSIATSAMMKAGADVGATGENPVIVACKDADVIMGPIGMLVADALSGEITPAMAVAVGQSKAIKMLLPVNLCNNLVVGTQTFSITKLISSAVEQLTELASNK